MPEGGEEEIVDDADRQWRARRFDSNIGGKSRRVMSCRPALERGLRQADIGQDAETQLRTHGSQALSEVFKKGTAGDGVSLKVVVGELEGGKEAITANGMHVISIISTCIYTPSFSGTETIAPAGFHISRRQ
jgi:hypothetical protein